MRGFTHLRRGECPICHGTRKDCRQSDSTELIHCRHHEANPTGYVFRGLDSIGFGMWQDASVAEAFSEEKREEWRQQRQVEQKQRQRELERQRAQVLSNTERDHEIRKLLSQLTLSHRDWENLQKRGLSDKEIEAGYFRSVEQWQRLTTHISDSLAGVKLGGNSLITPDSGYLCPIPNSQGQLVAWQLRRHHADEGGKYIWAASERKRKGYRPTAHLRNGELPIAVWRRLSPYTAFGKETAEVTSQTELEPAHHSPVCLNHNPSGVQVIGLTEGVSPKPFIAAQKLQQNVLGAAGANFAGSRHTFHAELETLSNEVETHTVVLYADGGAVRNSSVCHAYQKTFDLLAEWGYEVKVGWWGQVSKDSPDIDELEDTSAITHITPIEFFEIAQREQHAQKVAAAQKKLHNLTCEPDILLNEPYLPIERLIASLPAQGILNLKSSKGSGKSTLIKRLIEVWKTLRRTVISLTPRIALGREQAVKWEISWIDDCGVERNHTLTQQLRDNSETLGLCWDSLWKILPKDLSNAVIIIDEAELGFSHVATSSTCRERRPFIFDTLSKKLAECLGNYGLVLLSDADLTDVSVDYVKSLCPDAPVFTVVNQHKGKSWEVDFYTGKRDEVEAEIFNALERGSKIAVPTDSQKEAEALEREIISRMPKTKKVVRIDRKTTAEEFGREFVKNPNQSIEQVKPDVLIYTPSMGVGVSIELNYFDEVIGLFLGALEPSQCRQMLARVRAPVRRTVWCKEANHDLDGCQSHQPEVVKRQLIKYHKETFTIIDIVRAIAGEDADDKSTREAMLKVCHEMWNPETETWDNPHIDLYANLKARRNFGLSQLAVQLRQELIEQGHNLTDWSAESQTTVGDKIRDQKEEVQAEVATAVAHAQDVTLEEAKTIKANPHSTELQRHQADKAFLKTELPDVELTPELILKAVVKDKRRWLNAQKLFWLTQHPEIAQALDRKEWLGKLKQFAKYVPFIPDLRTYSAQVKALEQVGLFRLIDLENPYKEYTNEDEEVKKFLKRAYSKRHRLKTALNVTVTKKTEGIELSNRLLRRIGLELKCNRQETNDQGKRVRVYRHNLEKLNDPDRLNVLSAFGTRFAEIQTEAELDPAHNSSESINHNQSGVQQSDPTHNSSESINHNQSGVQQPKPAPLEENEETIADLAGILAGCESAEALQVLRETFAPSLLIKASKRLVASQAQKIREWLDLLRTNHREIYQQPRVNASSSFY